ncbi:PaaX family transcriptional regulator C-terminal domain-containing protein [Phyllobacterium zundukense]|uniref:PaaX family transcriptional regulator C-terminal domain-containing protein n=1 Tax=Phyllobacterium zundukense TaxID=1867719 RepID=UPI000C4FE8DD|nr:PaaX family transcriptional regulator C-terminal domain-containing protein [Phyllobacterium zundukense]ATU95104.1 hypothetical protein BLM14_25455 [Phyllobacterium zundukense]
MADGIQNETYAISNSVGAENWKVRLLEGLSIRAASLIVTIYGDIVVPRGGVLWMGTLIEVCVRFGISETHVRTAVSRLVGSGRLIGEREGRRSYYRLAEAAKEEFDTAARLLFQPVPDPEGWIMYQASHLEEETIRQQHLGRIGENLYIRPNHAHLPLTMAITFHCDLIQGQTEMVTLAPTLWPLAVYAEEYRDLIVRFGPVLDHLLTHPYAPEVDCVFVRLLLVHRYRHVLLADPLLPTDVLPEDWPGRQARDLFAQLYVILSRRAERQIADTFEGRYTRLPETTSQARDRLDFLRCSSSPTAHQAGVVEKAQTVSETLNITP